MKHTHKILVGKSEEKTIIRGPKHRLETNIELGF
jgi:hypothetical protein